MFCAKSIYKLYSSTIQETNGIYGEDIDDELKDTDPADCIYCDFDEEGEFPLDKSVEVENDDQKTEAIFNVIKYCWDNGKIPKYFSALTITLDANADDIKMAEAEYTKQCPKIFHSQENTLKEVFAIGLKS